MTAEWALPGITSELLSEITESLLTSSRSYAREIKVGQRGDFNFLLLNGFCSAKLNPLTLIRRSVIFYRRVLTPLWRLAFLPGEKKT